MNKYNTMLGAIVVGTMLVSALVLSAPALSLSSIRLPQIFYSALAQGSSVEYDFETEILPNGQPAYKLEGSPTASIPGPTIIVDEDTEVTINGVDEDFVVMGHPDEDGSDTSYTFTPSEPGTFVYKDGSSALLGLFGAVIVNDDSDVAGSYVDGESGAIPDVLLDELDKEVVMFMVGSTFWATEISGGSEIALWTNPEISAVEGDLVRFHVLSVGPGHTFHLHAHRWVDPGTTNIIDTKLMEEDEDSHVFIVEAGDSVGPGHWQYHCHVFAHMEAGMHGIFNVVETGPATSEAGATPYGVHPLLGGGPSPGLVTFEISDEPGSWFRNTVDISGITVTKSLALARPGDSVHFIMSDTNTVHTITSLLWPEGAEHMPMDEVQSYKGGGIVHLSDPGLYVFTCKVHPYMFGGVIADDPGTAELDLGDDITLVSGPTIPVASDLALRLAKTFFVATAPENWKDYADPSGTWNPSYPPVPVLASGVSIDNLDEFLEFYFQETENEALAPLIDPTTDGVGEVWVDTQFENTDGKSKPGTATAVDTTTWDVTKKVALEMNNPHNMWTDSEQSVIYQTQWFDNKLSTFDRMTGEEITTMIVGEAPSHVMTRANNDDIHVALNGEEGIVEILATTSPSDIERIIAMQGYGQNPTHPHAHWMSSDGNKMVTPNSFTADSTLYGFDTEQIDAKPEVGVIPIATGMMPNDSKYYVANLLSSSISVIDMDTFEVENINLLQDYNALALDLDKTSSTDDAIVDDGDGILELGALPIQTPVSPDGGYMVTANTLSGTITIVDTETDEIVTTLFCEPGCHGVQFGAKQDGGYYAYVSSKFANDLLVVDVDESSPTHLTIVGRILLNSDFTETTDETGQIIEQDDLTGMGGQGVLAIPNVYNGWIQNTVENEYSSSSSEVQDWICGDVDGVGLIASQRDPDGSGISDPC